MENDQIIDEDISVEEMDEVSGAGCASSVGSATCPACAGTAACW
ncbi:thiocillin family RiPP [Streptomyces roseoverticillatus]